MFPDGQSDRLGGLRSARFHRLVPVLFGMLLRHSLNNVCYSRIVRSTSIPNNIHITLVMVAQAFLKVMCAQTPAVCAPDPPSPVPASLASSLLSEAVPVLPLSIPAQAPLTVPEVRHLLGHLIWPSARQ